MPCGSPLTPLARQLRRKQTDAEQKLWQRLRSRQLYGAKFDRQAAIGSFIADFCCFDPKLIVEVDGGQHGEQRQAYTRRTELLERSGYRVLRFWNNEVLQDIDGVVDRIADEVAPLRPGASGEGE